MPDVTGRSSHKVRRCVHNHREERGMVIARPSHRGLTKSGMRRVGSTLGSVAGVPLLVFGSYGLDYSRNINSR